MNFSSSLAAIQNGSVLQTAPAHGAVMPPGAPHPTWTRCLQGAGKRQRIPQSTGILEGFTEGEEFIGRSYLLAGRLRQAFWFPVDGSEDRSSESGHTHFWGC